MENLFQKLLTTMVIYGIFIMAVGKAAMHRSYLYPHNPYFSALSQERARFFALPRKNGAREARERCAASRRQPVPRQPLRGAYEARERYAVSGRGPFLGTLFMVQPSCGAIRRFRAGDFALCGARENGAPARGQKDRQPTVFYPLGTPTFPLGYLGATERKRSYLEV